MRKGAVAVALLALAALAVPLLAQYYAWTINYTVEPLTADISVSFTTTGATYGRQDIGHVADIHLERKAKVVFRIVEAADPNVFAGLAVDIWVDVDNDGEAETGEILTLNALEEGFERSIVLPAAGDYPVELYHIFYATYAVSETVTGNFVIGIHAEEL